jgi:dipeptidyl aminopeptidase/acylaminoacyl peptidase
MMALLAARECSEAGPVAVWGGVSDLFDTYEERVDLRRMLRRVVGHPKKRPEAYEDRSPRRWVDKINVPVLIIHGTADVQVGVGQARRLADALEAAGKTYGLRLYEGVGHAFPADAERDALSAIFAWFATYRHGKEENETT